MSGGPPVRLDLVRHGRVDFDSKDFRETPRGPQWDPPLGERGREQAGHLARRLAGLAPLAGLFVSPYRRCRETVRPFEDLVGRTADVVDDLREVFIGKWEGVPFEDLMAEDAGFVRRRFQEQQPVFKIAPGAETGDELRARVVPAIERAIEAGRTAGGGHVIVVSHGGVINAYLTHILRVPHDMVLLPDNASVNSIDVDGDRRTIRFLNDVAHLAYPQVFDPQPAGREGGQGP